MVSTEGFVLAGGQSRRMGSNKANLLLGGTTLIERAAKTLSVVADPVFVVGDLRGETASLPVIADKPVGVNTGGAVIGLYTALANAKTEWIAVLACDLPFVSGDLLMRMVSLIDQAGEGDPDAVFVEQPDGRIQPLCALYRSKVCLPEIEKMVSEDHWRLQDLPTRLGSRILSSSDLADIPGADNWSLNVNTPEDYHSAIEIEAELG